MKAYNEKLLTWLKNEPCEDAGINNIQKPGVIEHVIWQNRAHAPSAYELDLVSHLIQAFESGSEELGSIVESLNRQGMRLETGDAWTNENFQQEMARLGY